MSIKVVRNGKFVIDSILENFDILFLDLSMPVMDGYEVLKHFKEMTIQLPYIIICSAHAMENDKKKCYEMGINDYLSKPYTPKKVLNTLSKYKQLKIK